MFYLGLDLEMLEEEPPDPGDVTAEFDFDVDAVTDDDPSESPSAHHERSPAAR